MINLLPWQQIVLEFPGDLPLASGKKMINQKDSNAPRSPDMFHSDS